MRNKSVLKWFGGKSRLTSKIIPLISQIPHNVFVDCFGGGGNIILSKAPSGSEIYNDVDSGLVNFFRIVANEETFHKFKEKLFLTPFSREEWEYAFDHYSEETDPIEKARLFFVKYRQSFGGLGKCWAVSKTPTSRGDIDVCAWLSAIDNLPEVLKRLKKVKIENSSFERIFSLYDTNNSLFYCDPPYVQDVRSDAQYENEMTNEQHELLVNLLLNMKGRAIVCGYENDIYKKLEENGWAILKFDALSMAFANTKYQNKEQGEGTMTQERFKRVECVWLDPQSRKNLIT